MSDRYPGYLFSIETHSRSGYLELLQATHIVIAHRLTTIQNTVRICLMDNGQIEETGTCLELQEKGGTFTELVKR